MSCSATEVLVQCAQLFITNLNLWRYARSCFRSLEKAAALHGHSLIIHSIAITKFGQRTHTMLNYSYTHTHIVIKWKYWYLPNKFMDRLQRFETVICFVIANLLKKINLALIRNEIYAAYLPALFYGLKCTPVETHPTRTCSFLRYPRARLLVHICEYRGYAR